MKEGTLSILDASHPKQKLPRTITVGHYIALGVKSSLLESRKQAF